MVDIYNIVEFSVNISKCWVNIHPVKQLGTNMSTEAACTNYIVNSLNVMWTFIPAEKQIGTIIL